MICSPPQTNHVGAKTLFATHYHELTTLGHERPRDGSHDHEQARSVEIEAILEELRGLEVDETPPIELMAKVQEWQEQPDDG